MTLLTSLAPSPSSLSTLPSDAAATAGGGQGARVRAVEYVTAVGDSLQDRARHAGLRQPGARQPGARQAGTRQAQGDARRPEDERPLGHREARRPAGGTGVPAESGLETTASALFLVQVFGQDQAPPQVFLAAHRDAAVLGSDAYRRAGATPPVYSEQPTQFRIAV